MNLQMKMMVMLIQDANTFAIVIVNTEQIMAAAVKDGADSTQGGCACAGELKRGMSPDINKSC